MSIRKSLHILLITSSMIPLILVSLIALVFLTDKMLSVNTGNLKQTAENCVSGLEAKIQAQVRELYLISIQDELIDAAMEGRTLTQADHDAVVSLLQSQCESYDNCIRISVYDANNEIVASSDAAIIENDAKSNITIDYIFSTKSTSVGIDGIKPLLIDDEIHYTLDIGSPIVDPATKSIIGCVINTIDISFLYGFLNSISIGESGDSILLDQNGKIIYHPNMQLIGTTISSDRLAHIISEYNLGNIEDNGAFEYYFDGQKQVFGYSVIPDLNWTLMLKQDVSEITEITRFLLILFAVVIISSFIIILFFADIFSKNFSAPIIALRDAMRTASDGNLTVQSNIKSNNELGELSKNFNKMLHIIKTNYDDLESMHEELLLNEEQLRTNYDHIEYLAYHDTLTSLPNKLAFLEYVNAVLGSSTDNSMHAVYFLDLDNFKTINDTLGHEYGDALLIKSTQLLSSIIGFDGMLARAGGDEFLIFKENVTPAEAVTFAGQIVEQCKNPLDLDGEIVYVSMSIGISIFPENGLLPNALIKNADIAMYKSKDTGKNKFTLFDKTMEEELNRNTIIIEVLRNAIENKEIYIQYQPLMEISTNNVIGYEALMRIRSERLGNISPVEFIPIAEESGLIIELSSWLIREVCLFNKKMINLGITPRPVSVNISSVQINRPGFVPLLSDILTETMLPPQYLELEITESTLVSSLMDATKLLHSLQELGVRISLDDFGTGFSSLNYLTKMPIDTLKIDKSFIDNICFNDKDSCIAESIIQLAHSLDIKVVAEGVEHEEQLALLRLQHCDIVQGYIYSRPLHPEALLEVLREDDLIIQCSLF